MKVDAAPGRILSLDQFRGYTVAGMFLVNFLGAYAVVPALLKHHKVYCSYADTIMPQFFLAVGFAYRLTFLRRAASAGKRAAFTSAVRRNLGLILLGLVMYHLDGEYGSWAELQGQGLRGILATAFRRDIFQTLVHIALTCLWILPVIGKSPRVRVGFMIGSGLLHLFLSQQFYYEWAIGNRVIDGGPLGFMTWTIPTLVGSLAYDGLVRNGSARSVRPFFLWGVGFMLLGYLLSCLGTLNQPAPPAVAADGLSRWLAAPPFFPPVHAVNLWTMSQRTGSLSYLCFSTGLALAILVLFMILTDRWGVESGFFRTLGQNALAGYVIHGRVGSAIEPFVPRDAPLWYVSAACLLFFAAVWVIMRFLEQRKLYLRL